MKKYIVRLTPSERDSLDRLVKTGKVAAYKRMHAQILLKADISEHGPGWKDKQISEVFGVTTRLVERLRKRLVQQGLEAAIQRAKGSGRKPKFTGDEQAHLATIACSRPPKGNTRWTLRMLADRMVQLQYVDSMSHESVRRLLKKTKLNHGKIKNGVFRLKKTQLLSAPWKMCSRSTKGRTIRILL